MKKIEKIETVEKTAVKFIADDGTEFDNDYDCKEYEHIKAMEKLTCIERCNELDNYPNFDGGECSESHSYIWYRPKDVCEIALLNEAYGNSFDDDMIGEWICVESDSYGDFVWVSTLDDGIAHIRFVLKKFGYEIAINKAEGI